MMIWIRERTGGSPSSVVQVDLRSLIDRAMSALSQATGAQRIKTGF
jgi:hypothetical protein